MKKFINEDPIYAFVYVYYVKILGHCCSNYEFARNFWRNLSTSIFFGQVVSYTLLYAALYYWITSSWLGFSYAKAAVPSPVLFLLQLQSSFLGVTFRARVGLYISNPRSPQLFTSLALPTARRLLGRRRNPRPPTQSGESHAILLCSSINRPRFPPIVVLRLIDLVSVLVWVNSRTRRSSSPSFDSFASPDAVRSNR